jgi:hypothetical protein
MIEQASQGANMQKLINALDEDDEGEHYNIPKKLIIEAWAKYRPSSNEGTPRGDDGSSFNNQKKNFGEIYGEGFLSKLMKGVKEKKPSASQKGQGIENLLLG